jgi:FkbM family methyltransferase
VTATTIIDVGANIGQFAVAASRIFAADAVYCFEPAPDCVARLRRNVASLRGTDVRAVALSDRTGDGLLYVNSHRHSSSMLPLAEAHKEAFPKASVIARVKTAVSTLDCEFADQPLRRPALLKIDVQGGEAAVIRGASATLKQVDYVVVETSFRPMYEGEAPFDSIRCLMEQSGFNSWRPVGWLSHPRTHEVLQMDALFIKS